MKVDGLTKMLVIFLIAFFMSIALALAGCLSATPVDVIRQHWEPVGPVMCHPTSDRVRVCTDARELSYHWVCEDRGQWRCAKVWRQ